MVNEFCGFRHGVIGKDLPADTTLNNMKKADLIKLLHTAQHNYESLMWFYNNAVKVNMSQLNNNGWIPCSELPEENGMYLCTVFHADDYVVWIMRFNDGEFLKPDDVEDWNYELLAWMSIAPYQPKGEELWTKQHL